MSMVGKTIGRLRITGVLGKGGMGEVYVAWDQALERKVALKSIRADQRRDDEARARFLREARILSQLDHPSICRLYELQEHPEGDFLVLELIEGQSLRRALRDGLDDSARMFIAERIAEALAAAHAKGIAHRDLKPDNVMLTDDGGVKVLDFGLANMVARQAAEPATEPAANMVEASEAPTVIDTSEAPTVIGEIPAEPPADPEQSWEPTVLAEILPAGEPVPAASTGPMFETQRGTIMGTIAYMSPEQARGERATAASDMCAFGLLIQELFTGEPAYPSELSTYELLVKASEVDTRPVRGIDPDLQALIGRLLSKVPEARPSAVETADRLAWIAGKRRRLWRRLAAATAVVALLVGGLIYTVDLRRERAAALAAQAEAEQVSSFLLDVFAVSQPQRARGREITARELLDRGAERIAGLDEQPRRQARMMLTIGQAYRQIGAFDAARPLLTEALAIHRRLGDGDTLDTASTLDQLASLDHDIGDFDRAAEHFTEALTLRRHHLGEEHPHVATSLNNLAVIERARGDDEAAERLLQRALGIYRGQAEVDPAAIAGSLVNLGDLYRARGDLDAAATALEGAVTVQEERLGADHPDLATSLNNLAMVRHQQGDPAAAGALYRRALDLSRAVLGDQHPQVAAGWNNLAELYRQTGRFGEAIPLYERAAELQRQILGDAHPSVALTQVNLADAHLAVGQLDAARALYDEATVIQQAALGTGHPDLATTLDHRADLERRVGDAALAESFYRRALAITLAARDVDHPSVVGVRTALAELLLDLGRADEAEPLLDAAMASAAAWVDQHPDDRAGRSRLAAVRAGLGRLEAARGDAEGAAEQWRAILDLVPAPTGDIAFVRDLHQRAVALHRLGRDAEAAPLVERLRATGWRQLAFDPALESSG